MIKRGDKGPEVAQAQRLLGRLGWDLVPDGIFGRLTEAAVVEWQEEAGLPVDGDLDARDLARLEEEAQATASASAPTLTRLPASIQDQLNGALDVATGGAWTRAVETGRPQPAGRHACVYGPGRGLWLERERAQREMDAGRIAAVDLGSVPGAWVTTRGPGGLGRSARQRSGQERPSFHCSSFTNWLAGQVCADPRAWTHTGNMPALERLLTERGRFVHSGGGASVTVQGFGDFWAPVVPDGTSARQHRLRGRAAARYMDPEEIWRRRSELGALTLLGQSTRTGRGWRYEHHTVALIRHPAWPDRLFRVAADGGRGAGGLYSGTPMDVEVVDHFEALRLEARVHYYAHTLTGASPRWEPCPIVPELWRP